MYANMLFLKEVETNYTVDKMDGVEIFAEPMSNYQFLSLKIFTP